MSNKSDRWTLRTRWIMRRNAMLGSGRFQNWAARLPVFRTVSRRYAAAQFDLVAGFVYSQILAAYVETGLLAFLNGQLRTVRDVSVHCGFTDEAADRLLRAGQALKLAESPQTGFWTLGEAGAALTANTGALAMIRHHHLLYRDLADPVKLLTDNREKQTALSAFWTYASRKDGDGDTPGYSALMAATQPMVFEQIVPAFPFGRHRRMLDIGGGSGAFANAVKTANPALHIGIFDLPPVIAEAKARLGDSNGDTDIAFHAGSFKSDSLPENYDLFTVVRILHDHDDDVVKALLAKIRVALPAGGQLLIVEPMAGVPSAPTMGDAYFGLYLWAMGSGRPRSEAEYRALLAEAGFSSVKNVKTNLPLITSALVAKY